MIYRFIYFLNGLSALTWDRFNVIFHNTTKDMSRLEFYKESCHYFSLISMPLWRYVSDRFGSKKRVFLVVKCINTLPLLLLS
mmetsp:Transcript_25114/g.35792  ORF Transcript_25114/g.35792 Transcript_25114/m.35792 type:complete len:82 (-) Transcript_25114:259-504(-)